MRTGHAEIGGKEKCRGLGASERNPGYRIKKSGASLPGKVRWILAGKPSSGTRGDRGTARNGKYRQPVRRRSRTARWRGPPVPYRSLTRPSGSFPGQRSGIWRRTGCGTRGESVLREGGHDGLRNGGRRNRLAPAGGSRSAVARGGRRGARLLRRPGVSFDRCGKVRLDLRLGAPSDADAFPGPEERASPVSFGPVAASASGESPAGTRGSGRTAPGRPTGRTPQSPAVPWRVRGGRPGPAGKWRDPGDDR